MSINFFILLTYHVFIKFCLANEILLNYIHGYSRLSWDCATFRHIALTLTKSIIFWKSCFPLIHTTHLIIQITRDQRRKALEWKCVEDRVKSIGTYISFSRDVPGPHIVTVCIDSVVRAAMLKLPAHTFAKSVKLFAWSASFLCLSFTRRNLRIKKYIKTI